MSQVAVKVLRAVPYDDEAARLELRQVGSIQLLNFELSPITRFFSWQSLEAPLEVWCALKHPNIADFLGLSYEVHSLLPSSYRTILRETHSISLKGKKMQMFSNWSVFYSCCLGCALISMREIRSKGRLKD